MIINTYSYCQYHTYCQYGTIASISLGLDTSASMLVPKDTCHFVQYGSRHVSIQLGLCLLSQKIHVNQHFMAANRSSDIQSKWDCFLATSAC